MLHVITTVDIVEFVELSVVTTVDWVVELWLVATVELDDTLTVAWIIELVTEEMFCLSVGTAEGVDTDKFETACFSFFI